MKHSKKVWRKGQVGVVKEEEQEEEASRFNEEEGQLKAIGGEAATS